MDGLPSLTPPPTDPPDEPASPARAAGASRWVLAAVLPALVGGAVAYAVARGAAGDRTTTVTVTSGAAATTARTATRQAPRAGSTVDIPAIVEASQPGVVEVETASGLGTGFLIDAAGHVLTNSHVVDDARVVDVVFEDGTVRQADVLASDPAIDLAVIDVGTPPSDARVLPLGRSKDLRVGETVIAIGNPLGQQSSVTSGIVSATERTICSPNNSFIGNAIQTDAAINPGNSGGPLLNGSGEVVGINSQILSQGGGNEGIGFAVPIDTIRPVANGIISGGKPRHAWIGIVGETLTPQLSRQLGLADAAGVVLRSVEDGGPAKKAGLVGSTAPDNRPPRGGDVIVAVAGESIADFGDLTQEISSRSVGDRIDLTVLRDGRRITVTLTLADRPASQEGTCNQ